MDITKMTALEIGAAIRRGEITSVDAVKALLQKIKENDDKLNAYITVNGVDALKRAEEVQMGIESGEYNSLLAGVPIAVKDNICTKGIKTTCGSKMLCDFEPVYNATVIEKLENAGMIILGKTNMDEFAMGSTCEMSYFGATKNFYDDARVAGGSSGGSASAVASNEAAIALGSDTGGSIRQPAAYSGVVGFKPSYASVSRFGLIAYASSLDQIGPIARNVSDCAALFDIIKGKDSLDSTSVDFSNESTFESLNDNISSLKIAVFNQFFEDGIDLEVKESVFNSVKLLELNGAKISFVDFPLMKYLIPTYYIIASAEAASNLSRYDGVKYGFKADGCESISDIYVKSRTEGFGKEVKKRILLGNFVLSSGYYDAYYLKALRIKALIKAEIDKIFEDFDVIICPTAPTTANLIGECLKNPLQMYLSDVYTVIANLAGLPAISLPCGFDKNGLPIGMQIIGKAGDDRTVLNTAYAFERRILKAEVKG